MGQAGKWSADKSREYGDFYPFLKLTKAGGRRRIGIMISPQPEGHSSFFHGFRKALGTAVVLLCFFLLGHIFFSRDYRGRFWAHWYPLLVPSSEVTEGFLAGLKGVAGQDIVCAGNSILEYCNFKGMAELSVRDFLEGKGLWEADPRVDFWMRGSRRWFFRGDYEIFYLPARISPLAMLFRLRNLPGLESRNFLLPDAPEETFRGILPYGLVLVLLLVFCFGFPAFICPALPLGFLVFLSFAEAFQPALIPICLFALSLRLLMESRGRSLGGWILFLGGAASGILSLFRVSFFFLTALSALAFSRGFPGLLRSRNGGKRVVRGRDHALFRPVQLSRSPDFSSRGKKGFSLPVSVWGVAGTAMVLALLFPGTKELPVSLPIPSGKALWTYESLRELPVAGEVPGPGDYVRHRAYQESFLFGGNYTFPERDSCVILEKYELYQGKIHPREEAVLRYDDAWFAAVIADMGGQGPGKLLRSEPCAPEILECTGFPKGIPIKTMAAYGLLLVLILLLQLPVLHRFRAFRKNGPGGCFLIKRIYFRRKQQAA